MTFPPSPTSTPRLRDRALREQLWNDPSYGLFTSSMPSSLPLSLPVSLPSMPSLSASPSKVGSSSLRTVKPSFLYPSSSWSALPLLTATAPMDVAESKMGRKYLRMISRSWSSVMCCR